MSRWPWVTLVAAAIVALTPLARELFYEAFVSSERWMQDLLQMIYLAGVAIAVVLGIIEWAVRTMIVRRRARAPVAEAAARANDGERGG